MKSTLALLAKILLVSTVGILLLASLASCRRYAAPKDIEVTSRTKYLGTINGTPIAIDVVATINTGRGGKSTCTFTSLPNGFNPGTLGTMA